jgi:hypothetical protein
MVGKIDAWYSSRFGEEKREQDEDALVDVALSEP